MFTNFNFSLFTYNCRTYNTSDCSGAPFGGLWEQTGCVHLSDSYSASATCTGEYLHAP